jgi:hypothetical protein
MRKGWMTMEITLPEEVLHWFTEDALPLPPLPETLVGALREADDFMYASSPLPEDMTPGENYLCLGFYGHGVQSWRLRYRLRHSGLSFALDLPWGGIYRDREVDKEALEQGFLLARLCLAAMENAPTRSGLKKNGLSVQYSETDCSFRCLSAEGECLKEGNGLNSLLDLLEQSRQGPRPIGWMPV